MKSFTLSLCLGVLLVFSACGEEKQNTGEAGLQEPVEEQEQGHLPIASDSVPITENTSYSHEVVVPGLQIAWGMTFLPDGSMLVSEKHPGRLRRSREPRGAQGARAAAG